MKNLAVIIPCRNEAKSIAKVIEQFPREALAQHDIRLSVHVIDNNSSDNTAQIAKAAGAMVLTEKQQGKGNALRTGFRSIPHDTDYVAMLDGDDTYSPQEILRIIEPLQNNFCDVVLGSRLGGRIQTAAMNRLNQFGNHLFTSAVRNFYGVTVTDVLTGYFAWKKSALDTLAPHITSPGFAIEMEMITKMARLNQHMVSVPISYHPREGNSHLRPFRDGLRIGLMLLKNLLWKPTTQLPPPTNVPNFSEVTKEDFLPRKIVFVSDAIYPYMKGGKEKRLHEITKRLAAMGHEVHIYTMHWWKEQQKTRIENGVYLHALCKQHELYHGNRRSIKEGIVFGLACFKLMRVPFDVLDVDHMPFFPIFSSWIVCALRGRRLYATWHEALSHQEWVRYMGHSGFIAAFIERLSTFLPYRITAASSQTKDLLAMNHRRIKRVELVGSGIDTSLLNNIKSAEVECDILYAGRLVKDKNVNKLVDAVALIAKSHPEVRCIIIGSGFEKTHLCEQVKALGIGQNVTFLDPLPEAADVYAYMKAAKVFCSPSVREGFGIVSLEALGCGTPVVTVNSAGNAARHLVHDGQNGSVVPPEPTALAEAILYWISASQKPSITAELADCDWHNLAKKQAEVYML